MSRQSTPDCHIWYKGVSPRSGTRLDTMELGGPRRYKKWNDKKRTGKVLKQWDLDSAKFYLRFKDKLRDSKDCNDSRKLKTVYQSIVKMTATPPGIISGNERLQL